MTRVDCVFERGSGPGFGDGSGRLARHHVALNGLVQPCVTSDNLNFTPNSVPLGWGIRSGIWVLMSYFDGNQTIADEIAISALLTNKCT